MTDNQNLKYAEIAEMAKAIKPVMPCDGCGKDLQCHFKTNDAIDCPECSIANALYNAGCRMFSNAELQHYYAYKHIEPQIKGCLDRENALLAENKKLQTTLSRLKDEIILAIDSNIKAMNNTKSEELFFTCNGKKLALQGILDYIDELMEEN